MRSPMRSPNWDIQDGLLVIVCPSCSRWLFRTTVIQVGAMFWVNCRSCRCEREFVTPPAVVDRLEAIRNANPERGAA